MLARLAALLGDPPDVRTLRRELEEAREHLHAQTLRVVALEHALLAGDREIRDAAELLAAVSSQQPVPRQSDMAAWLDRPHVRAATGRAGWER